MPSMSCAIALQQPCLAPRLHRAQHAAAAGSINSRRRLARGAGIVTSAAAAVDERGQSAAAAAHGAVSIPELAGQASSLASPPGRKTKVVATIGPTSCDRDSLFRLADMGMSVVRLNMSHGSHESHAKVVDLVKEYNASGRGCLAILLDTKGPEVRSGDVAAPLELAAGDRLTFTTVEGADGSGNRVLVNYDEFPSDARVGDVLLVDGGLLSMRVESIEGTDVVCSVVDGGSLGSRRHLNIRGKSANLPAITQRDWADIEFGLSVGVDYFALSFVRDAGAVHELKRYLAGKGLTGTAAPSVISKIESADSVTHLEEILDASDGAMVARGDLGAELPVEEVPYWQTQIVQGCRRRAKPCIVATHMLESMITCPTPTRAEVSDISVAVREGADAVMLSGETAFGAFPFKALETMTAVAERTEGVAMQLRHSAGTPVEQGWGVLPARLPTGIRGMRTSVLSEVFASHAVTMANSLSTSLVVFTRKGTMPALLSHYRPDYPVYCFTESESVQRRLALFHGVQAIRLKFTAQEDTFERAIALLRERGQVKPGQLVALVQSGRQPIWRSASTHIIQVRTVPSGLDSSGSDESDCEDVPAQQ